MQVICTTHQDFNGLGSPSVPVPDIGEIVTVINERVVSGIDCYELAEYQSNSWIVKWFYDKRNFSPLDGPDETELVTEEFEEKYCVPVNEML
jgi:hypothetical protein